MTNEITALHVVLAMRDDIELKSLALRHPYAEAMRSALRPEEERISADGTEVERVYSVTMADAIAFSSIAGGDVLHAPEMTGALLKAAERVFAKGIEYSGRDVRPGAVPDLMSELEHLRLHLEGRLGDVQAKLRSEFSARSRLSERQVLHGIRLRTEETNLAWALEMLPDSSELPVRKGQPRATPTPEALEKSIVEARNIFQKRIDEVSSALAKGDLSHAQIPRVGADARAELEVTVAVLNRVLELAPAAGRGEPTRVARNVVPDNEADAEQRDRLVIGSPQDRNTILAALRFYQRAGMGKPTNRSDDIHHIATKQGEDGSPDAEAIDALCARVASASVGSSGPRKVRVLVSLSDGIVDYRTDDGVDVHVFDRDIYEDDPAAMWGVPNQFRDLAESLGIPVGSSDSLDSRAATTDHDDKRERAQTAFEAYDFGDGVMVHDHDPWDTSDAMDFTKIVYLGYPEDDPESELHKTTLHVRFRPDAALDQVYALEVASGNQIGKRIDAREGEPPEVCAQDYDSPSTDL
ncbi:hypothetical protein [Burkholderia ubonensis]|uniref:hypothetical protein n=1 Tax=Burkholderia ubonensis TaxID=101571 RepID=UPI000759A38C|nr:hypothetical protein [Burkholderia ubonensis]KVV07340.1 hypothetical protein WK77_16245 [Burkholderia ubonensis]